MAKIAIDARESGTSTGRYIDKLIEYLHHLEPRHEIIIVTKAHRKNFFAQIAPNFKTVITPYQEFTFGEQLGFKKQLTELKVDLIHFGMVQQPVWYRGKTVTTLQDLTTLRFRNPSKNPLVFTLKQQVYKWVNKRVAHKATLIITPTEFVKKDIVNFAHIKPEKITVTYEAADKIIDAATPVGDLEGQRFIMYVGRPTPHKNLWRLIEAFKELKKLEPNLRLVLAGKKDDLYKAIEQRVGREHIADVIFTDFVSEGQLRWLYEHTVVYAFPSLSEGFGLPGLEAMMHGAAVAASNATCLPEVYKDAAQYFDPLDVEDMVTKITEVLVDPILRADLIEKGHKVADSYSWQRMAQQSLEVYERALKN